MTRSDMTPESTVPHTADGEKLDSPQNQPPDSLQGAQGRDTQKDTQDARKDARALPSSISIPEIRGEMLVLRPAVWEDCEKLDELDAFHDSARITGKSKEAERSTVRAWVSRYLSWSRGELRAQESFSDPEARGVIAWSMFAQSDLTGSDDKNESDGNGFVLIGMVFLIDIDGWAKSARIQVLLGRDYRSRGFSRDAMPRVMTYGFAPEPAGLGMHRIWVSVPEKNSRSISVYQSLGFVPSGTSRDALWDVENNKYQDLIVMDTLVDEYDPIRSLDAFGMHLIEDNPGVKEALSAREHSIAIQQNKPEPEPAQRGEAAAVTTSDVQSQAQTPAAAQPVEPQAEHHDDTQKNTRHSLEEESNWPYGQAERKPSKEAWWRTLGRGRKRDTESE